MGTVTLRQTAAPDGTYSNKNAALTHAELDNNFTYFLRNDTSDSMTGGLTTTSASSFAGATVSGFGGTSNLAVGSSALSGIGSGTTNTALGHLAASNINSGSANVFVGYDADTTGTGAPYIAGSVVIGALAATSASDVVAVGASASTSGAGGVAVGKSANANPSGTAVGYQASIYSTTTSNRNTSLGYQALRGATSANTYNDVTAVGYLAGFGATTGNGANVFIGSEAGYSVSSATRQVAVGYQALDSVTSGNSDSANGHTAVGYRSLADLTTGSYNTALGYNTGSGLTVGSNVVYVGYGAGVNSSGDANTAVGSLALQLTTAYNSMWNVAVGTAALSKCSSPSNGSVAVGAYSVGAGNVTFSYTGGYNIGIGYRALFVTTSGVSNVAMGANAGQNVQSGNNNTMIGDGAGLGLTTGSNNILIGSGAVASTSTTSGQCVLGSTNITDLRCNDQTIAALSDARDKTDIIDSPYGLDFINSLKPRQFKWQSRYGNAKDGLVHLGFIAQELLESTQGKNDILNLVLDEDPDRLEAKVGNLIPIIVKAIQEIDDKYKSLLESN